MSRKINLLSISSSIIILSISYTKSLSPLFGKLRYLSFGYWNRTMIVCSLHLRTTVVSPYYQTQKFYQNISMTSKQLTRSYGNNRRRSRGSIDSGDESDNEDSDDEESNRNRISRRRRKKRVKNRIPDYDEFARFRDSSRPPDTHYTSVEPSSSAKESTTSEEPSAPSEEPPAANEEKAPPEEDPNTKK